MKILELNHFKQFVIRLDHERFPVQIRVKAFTSVHYHKKFAFNVDVSGFSVGERLAGECNWLSCMRTAPSPFCELSTCSALLVGIEVCQGCCIAY